jgi:hypothetical protein
LEGWQGRGRDRERAEEEDWARRKGRMRNGRQGSRGDAKKGRAAIFYLLTSPVAVTKAHLIDSPMRCMFFFFPSCPFMKNLKRNLLNFKN